MQNTLQTFQSIIQLLKVLVDFLIVWILVYYILRIVRNNSRTVQIFKGVVVVVVLRFIALKMSLTTTTSMLDFALQYGILVFAIIFQPEIRSVLEKLGKSSVFSPLHGLSGNQKERLIHELVDATVLLSERKTGALITLEQGHSLNDYIKTGTAINSSVTSELLTSIFVTSTPLHDGAVIIQGDRIAAASAYFPPTGQELPTRYGARHRAAIGISETTDSITIVVSEETGMISIAEGGKLREMDETSLRDYLNLIIQNLEQEVSQSVTTKRARRFDFSRLNIDPIKIEKVDEDDIMLKEVKKKDPEEASGFMKFFARKKKPKDDVKKDDKKADVTPEKEEKKAKKESLTVNNTSEETMKRLFKKDKQDKTEDAEEVVEVEAAVEEAEETKEDTKTTADNKETKKSKKESIELDSIELEAKDSKEVKDNKETNDDKEAKVKEDVSEPKAKKTTKKSKKESIELDSIELEVKENDTQETPVETEGDGDEL